jgi:aminoglycoside phosphotransferase (APT) family kinase protein
VDAVPASASKTPVDRATARAIVVDAFGPDADLVSFDEITDGWFNALYALGLTDGRRVALKVGPPPDLVVQRYEHGILHAEVTAIGLVLAHTRAPAPEVLHVDASGHHVPGPFFVMDLLPGRSLFSRRDTLDDARRATADAEVGAHLRAINAIAGDAFGLLAPGRPTFATWPAAFGALVDLALADAADRDVPLPRPAAALRALVEAGHDALAEVTTPRLVHWDLWDGNVLVDPDTGHVTGLVDFERALWGDPLMEVQFRPLAVSPAFQAGYGRALLDSPAALHRRRLYNLYLYLVMITEGAYRHYDDDAPGRWARRMLDDELPALDALA